MVTQLASLLLPIDALLNHSDFPPPSNASPNVVTLFRNMWFLCVLFQFTIPSDQRQRSAMDWQQPALARIAMKTPPLILEEAQDTIVSDLEYNTVIRQEYIETVSAGIVCVLYITSLNDFVDHFGTSHSAGKAYTHSRQRDPLPASWTGHIFVVHARYGEHALCGGASIFAGAVLCEQWAEQECRSACLHGICGRKGTTIYLLLHYLC